MGMKCDQQPHDVSRFFIAAASIIEKQIRIHLQLGGERCVNRVRDRDKDTSWIDQTGNLRSSIGYAVAEYGRKELEGGFKEIAQGKDGTQAAKDAIDRLIPLYTQTYALIVVAGMDYASYVEDMNGKDVLASTELWAKPEMSKLIAQALTIAARKINSLKI